MYLLEGTVFPSNGIHRLFERADRLYCRVSREKSLLASIAGQEISPRILLATCSQCA
jgi:hypothetical protein